MTMKKNALKSAIAALGVSAVTLSSTAMIALAGGAVGSDKYDTSKYDPTKATIKPTVTVSTEKIAADKAGSNVTITVSVKDAEGKYGPTGLHIQWDKRLTLVKRDGDYAEKMDAGKKLSYDEEADGENGVFVTTMASDDVGRDGVLWALDFTVPADAKSGDFFPVEIAYKTSDNAKDLFTNCNQDEAGQLMQAWVFTNGIVQGGVQVGDPITTTTTTAPATTTTTTTKATTSTTKPATTTTTTKATTSTTKPATTTTTTTAKATTTSTTTTKPKTTAAAGKDAANTGVGGMGLAVAGLAIAVGTAFACRKKED
jgi:hypothetical protein